MNIKKVLLQRFINFLIKGLLLKAIENENMSNKELAEELHKPIIREFKERKVQSPFIDNIWSGDLADVQLISKVNKEIRILLCVIDIFIKYAWVIPLKDKRGITITNALQKILDKSNRKPNKIWVDRGSEFYNKSMKSWLEKKNAIEIIQHIMKESLLLLKDLSEP